MIDDIETLIAEFAHAIGRSEHGRFMTRSATKYFAETAYRAIRDDLESVYQTEMHLRVMRARAPKITP